MIGAWEHPTAGEAFTGVEHDALGVVAAMRLDSSAGQVTITPRDGVGNPLASYTVARLDAHQELAVVVRYTGGEVDVVLATREHDEPTEDDRS